jgi:hypothetical protein
MAGNNLTESFGVVKWEERLKKQVEVEGQVQDTR